MTDPATTLVVGIDGATWRLLNQWIDDGELPNLERIRADSATATLQPCLPPVTSPNWKCYSTGKNPGKLGVYWWEIVDIREREIRIPDAASFHSAELWDYLSQDDREVAVVNMPLTFPPHAVNGVLIARSSANHQRYTYPDGLKDTIEERFDYRANPERRVQEPGFVEEILELLELRFTVLRWILTEKDPDFAHVTLFMTNKLQHYFWDGEPTLRGWKTVDEELGWFVDRDYNIVFMSDHGCNEIETSFQANAWLEREGYLYREGSATQTADSVVYRFGLTKESMSKLTTRLGIRDALKRVLPRSIIDSLPTEGVYRGEKFEAIDWDETDAIASGQGLIYLTDPDGPGYDQRRDAIIDDLSSLTDTRTERPVARQIYRREDLYSGDNLSIAPDIVFDQSEGIHTDDIVGEHDVFEPPGDWRGENEPAGIFMAHGPAFDPDSGIDQVEIVDIMPTVLHLLGEAVPDDVDGTVLDLFEAGTEPAIRDVTYREPLSTPERSNKAVEGAEERLRDLGYLN